ncbi:MAG: hypothetical protein COA49_01385 [Bacteroidetes bacterium]|nr:MAG: hypothetical protein COA49_01385 [Bacteroidota bacterium]
MNKVNSAIVKFTGLSIFALLFLISSGYSSQVYGQAMMATDLSLEGAIFRGIESNYGIRTARLGVVASEINNSWGAAGAMPTLSSTIIANTAVSDQTENPTSFIQDKLETDGISGGLNVNWTLFNGMGMFASKSRLELLESQSEGQVALIIENTVQAIDLAYHNTLVQIQLLQVLTESMELSRDRLNEILWSEEYGAAGTFDRLQFENAILADSAAWLQQGVAVRASIRNLNRLMGDDENVDWIFTSKLIAPPRVQEYSSILASVLSNNVNISNAILSNKISHQEVKQSQAFLYPVLGLTASFSDATSQYSAGDIQGSGRTINTSALLTLNFNLFNGGATKRAIALARIQEEISLIDEENIRNQVSSLTKDAYERYILSSKVYDINVKASRNASISLSIAEASYKNSVINVLDYRLLEVALQRARVKELQSLLVWREAYIELQKLTGALRGPIKSF